jgi:ankyrin repeat protein
MVGGADLEMQDCNGDTPLHVASRVGNRDMVSVLLSPIELRETGQNEYRIPVRNIPQNLEIRNSKPLYNLLSMFVSLRDRK